MSAPDAMLRARVLEAYDPARRRSTRMASSPGSREGGNAASDVDVDWH